MLFLLSKEIIRIRSVRYSLSSLLALLWLFSLWTIALSGGVPDGPNVQITDAGLGDDSATLARLAVFGESVYAVWEDGRDNPYDADLIYFAKSTDGGRTWGQNIQINELPYDDWAQEPQIAVNQAGHIWIIWHTFYKDDSDKINDVRLALSTDDGETFSVITLIDGYDDSADRRYPHIVADQSTGIVYMLFHEYRRLDDDEGYNVDFMAINPDGTTAVERKWINDAARSGRGTFPSIGSRDDMPFMDITARDGIVCVAWEDERERASVFGTCSEDGGTTFSPNFNISGADGIEPRIALGPDGVLHAIYSHDSDRERNLLLRRTTNLGVTWSEEKEVTTGQVAFKITTRDLEIDENNQIVIVWNNYSSARGDVILSTSLDQGVNFSHQRVDDDPEQNADTDDVALAVSGTGLDTRAYIAWTDDRIDFDNKIWSQPVILDGIGPSVPDNPQATGQDNAILLTWSPSTDSTGIRTYRIYRASTADGPFVEIAPRGAYSTFYRDVELLNGETYFYQIAAVDGTGNTGVRSQPISASAQVGQGLPPNGTIAFKDGENIKLLDLPTLGNPRTVSQGSKPYFSADGSRLYYYANNTVTSKQIAGGDDQIHLQNSEFYGEYDISTDGTQIGAIITDNFVTVDGTLCFVSEPTYFDRGLPRYVEESNQSTHIAISSTGTWLVYDYPSWCNVAAFGIITPPSFCIVNTTSSEEKCIEGADFEAPDFAASGPRIAFAAKESGQNEIWTAEMQDDGTLANYIQLTRGPENQPSTEPAFSSNGEWIIFQRDMDTSENESFQLYAVKSDGTSLRALNTAGSEPSWFNGAVAPAPDPNPSPNENPGPNPDPVPTNLSPSIFVPLVQ